MERTTWWTHSFSSFCMIIMTPEPKHYHWVLVSRFSLARYFHLLASILTMTSEIVLKTWDTAHYLHFINFNCARNIAELKLTASSVQGWISPNGVKFRVLSTKEAWHRDTHNNIQRLIQLFWGYVDFFSSHSQGFFCNWSAGLLCWFLVCSRVITATHRLILCCVCVGAPSSPSMTVGVMLAWRKY